MSPDAQERLDARERLLAQLDLADATLIAGLWSRAAALMELVAGDLHIADRPSPEAGAGWRGIGPKLVGAADFDARGCERARQMLRDAHDLEAAQLRSLAQAALDEMEEAWRLLREALIRTHSAGSLRHLLDEGEALARMLRGRVSTLREPALLSLASALFTAMPAGQPAPLSPQERRVLALLAQGRSNPEIAQELVVSVNTVKTQLKHIFRKLHARSRQEACQIARDRGLL